MHHSLSSGARRRTEVYDPLKLEKHKFPYSDVHSKNNPGNKAPKCSGTEQTQQAARKSFDQEELVKYMSHLPTYLEKGKNLQENALNVGVLDWRRLQKWQYNQKLMPSIINSSILPTEKTTMHSSRGHSWSPARQRFPSCTLQSSKMSKNEFRPYTAKSSTENTSKWQEHDQSGKILKGQLKEFKYLGKIERDEDCKGFFCSRSETKGKLKIQEDETSHDSINSAALASSSDQRSKEPNRRSFSKSSSAKDVINNSSVHFRPLPRVEHGIKHQQQQMQNCNSMENRVLKISSISRSISPNPSRCRNSDPKKSTALLPMNSNVLKYDEESTPRRIPSEKTNKLRSSPSPTRRLIMGMARIGRISFSKDGPDDTARNKLVDSITSIGDTARTPNGNSRSQSSPLRRLLIDPWLKPKLLNSDSMSIDRPSRSSHGRIESFPEHSKFKTKNDVCGLLNHSGQQQVSALLQISIKNGLPLFTFAIENSNDILAATRRKMNAPSTKDENSCRWIYTFFNVQEVRKKTSWINNNNNNPGNKGKGGGYIPNAIAQMIVSDHTHLSIPTREFVLFSTGDIQSDLQAKDELASIVIKFQKNTGITNNNDNAHLAGSGFLFNTTVVVLPGGIHGIPSGGGEPSPLIERWRSGGKCDCGGWDLGCKIKVLANQTQQQQQPGKISNASRRTGTRGDRFEIFSQGEQHDDKPVLSLSPYRDGIFSVEFNSPLLTCIQAFSICISVVNSSRKLNHELPNSTKLFEAKCCEEEIPALSRNIGIRSSNRIQRELAPSYPPPLSPFGRA